MSITTHRRHRGDFTWEDTPVLAYKQADTAPFRDVTRQVLFEDAQLGCQLRYFEIAPAGHTTLERHQHLHAVMIIRGGGQCLVGERVFAVAEHDLVHIPGLIWHQFRADAEGPLGFLCLVNAERDRPQLPSSEDLVVLCQNAHVAAFIRS